MTRPADKTTKLTVGKRVVAAISLVVRMPDGSHSSAPIGATCEITRVPLSSESTYDARVVWKDSAGVIHDGIAPHCSDDAFDFGRGRPMFPGETPPRKGEVFGVTGVNNDYAKQGRKFSPSSPAAPTPATMPTVIGGAVAPDMSKLTDDQIAQIGDPCTCGKGHFAVRSGTVKTTGRDYTLVGCDQFPACKQRVTYGGAMAIPTGTSYNGAVVTSTPTVVASPAVPVAPPATKPSPAEAAKVVAAAVAAAPVKPTAPAYQFPLTNAMKLAADVRKMAEQGSTEMTFSLRKCLAWATATAALVGQGVPGDDALAAAFRLTVYDRETEDGQAKLATLFQSMFGDKPTDNKSKHPALTHESLVETALANGLNLWLSGPTGCGKTYTVLDTLKRLARPSVRVQGGGDITRETLIGYPALTNGTSTFKPGPLTYAMENGLILILDEVDKLRDEVLSELTAVLEGNPLVLMDDSGRVVVAGKGFGVVATANTVGRGEGLAYGGTRTVNEALRDRFVYLSVGYDNDRDRRIVGDALKGLNIGVK